MSSAGRKARAVFSRFVAALNRRDHYQLELDDPYRVATCRRQTVLRQRLATLQREIADYESDLAHLDRQRRGLD